MSTPSELNPIERAALTIGRLTNERPELKRLQMRFIRAVTQGWVRPAIAPRVYVEGVDWLASIRPDRGVLVAANHRSFFDMYIITLSMFESGADEWVERLFFPVRANFFYEHPLGMTVNLAVGGGVMYPPIFRDAARAELNKDAVDRVCRFLGEPGTVVGMHPEGTRGKGPDPYELLPAQPGVGQIILQAKPIVVPIFINGLPNDLAKGISDSYRKNARRDNPVIVCFGEELDYSEFADKKPRAALYKRCSDKLHAAIQALSERERAIRAACAAGEISDRDPNWLKNRSQQRG